MIADFINMVLITHKVNNFRSEKRRFYVENRVKSEGKV